MDELRKMFKTLYGYNRKFSNDRRKLNRLLKKADIDFEWHPHPIMQRNITDAAYQWTFPKFPEGDVIIGPFSFGACMGCFESYGMPWDNQEEGYNVTALKAKELVENLTKGK